MIPPRFLRTVPQVTTVVVEGFWDTFRDHHPDWEFVTLRDPIHPEDFPLTSPHWYNCSSGAQRAGLIRLEALWNMGGFYVDSDVECFRDWSPLRGARIVAGWEDPTCCPDAVIGTEAGDTVLREMIDLAIERIPAGAWESGPGVTTTILPRIQGALLLPPDAFYPVHYTAKEQCAFHDPAPWTYALHHWHASWVPQARRTQQRRRRR